MTPPPARSPGILSRYPEWVSKHRCAILMSAAALATIAIAAATTLPIRTDFSQLLPAREPSVVSLRRLTARKATTAVVEIGIAATDPAAAREIWTKPASLPWISSKSGRSGYSKRRSTARPGTSVKAAGCA